MARMVNKNLQFPIQGIIRLESGDYVFRGDVYAEQKYFAWMIEHEDITDRSQCYKWTKLPRSKRSSLKGDVILFNIDNPPRTVSYLPILE